MRSPSARARGRAPTLSEPKPTPPLLAALAPLRVAARRRATVLRPAVPLGVSPATAWNALTASAVAASKEPSAVTSNPARCSSCCSSRTSVPLTPARSVREPSEAADVGSATAATGATSVGTTSIANADMKTALLRLGTTAKTPSLGAYGVSCRARAKKAALHRTQAVTRP